MENALCTHNDSYDDNVFITSALHQHEQQLYRSITGQEATLPFGRFSEDINDSTEGGQTPVHNYRSTTFNRTSSDNSPAAYSRGASVPGASFPRASIPRASSPGAAHTAGRTKTSAAMPSNYPPIYPSAQPSTYHAHANDTFIDEDELFVLSKIAFHESIDDNGHDVKSYISLPDSIEQTNGNSIGNIISDNHYLFVLFLILGDSITFSPYILYYTGDIISFSPKPLNNRMEYEGINFF